MSNLQPVNKPFEGNLKLNFEQCASTEEDKEDMKRFSQAYVIGSLMYVMIFKISYIYNDVYFVSNVDLCVFRYSR